MSIESERHGPGTVEARQGTGWDEGGRASARVRPAGDGMAMKVLRVSAYVLTSLASVLFIAVVVHGAVQLNRLGAAVEQFSSSFPASGPSSSSTVPPDMSAEDGYIGYTLTPDELDAYCPEVPDDPTCELR